MKLRALLIIAAAGLMAGGALAQTPGGPPPPGAPPWSAPGPHADHERHGPMGMEAAKKACAPDMASLCAGKTGPDAMMCMHDNHDKLSKPCQDAIGDMRAKMRHRMEERREAMEAAKKTCAPDMASLCAGKTGREAMMCMHENRDKVSQPCKDAIAKVRHHRMFGRRWGRPMGGEGMGPPSPERRAAMEAAKKACEPDMAALCAGKTGREAMMCMRENHDKVSQTCKDAMAKARPMHGHGHGKDGAPPPMDHPPAPPPH